jgi:MFS family permease
LLAHAAIRRFALSMVGIFSPVYVYKVFIDAGYLGGQGLAAALLFWAVLFLAKALAIPAALNQAMGRGLRWVLAAAAIPLLLFLLVLAVAASQPVLLVLSGSLWGLAAGFFWVGFHGFFVHLGDGNHFGKEVGWEHVLDLAAGFLGPLLGGLIIQALGFSWLFGGAAVLTLVSLAPLLRIEPREKIRRFSVRKEGKLLLTHPRAVVAYAGAAGSTVLNLSAWPVFIFLLFGSYLELGAITAAAVLGAGVVTIAVGFLVDRQGKRRWIKIGALGEGSAWVGRIFVRSVAGAVAADAIFRVFARVMYVPLDALTYQKAQEGGRGFAIFFREMTQSLAAIWILVLGAGLVLLGVSFPTLFALGALASVGPLLLRPVGRPGDEKA